VDGKCGSAVRGGGAGDLGRADAFERQAAAGASMDDPAQLLSCSVAADGRVIAIPISGRQTGRSDNGNSCQE